MTTLEDLYLPGEPRWLLNPDAPRLPALARDATERGPASACSADQVLADLPLLTDVIRERHFGVVDGLVPLDAMAQAAKAITRAEQRIRHYGTLTWGAATNELTDDLRTALGDNNFRLLGCGPSRTRSAEARLVHGRDATPVDTSDAHGVRCVTLRSLSGNHAQEQVLERWAQGSTDDFAHDKIVVDLRGNGGGNDGFVLEWLAPHLPAPSRDPRTGAMWVLGQQSLLAWNTAAMMRAAHGPAAIPARWAWALRQLRGAPMATHRFGVSDEEPAGPRPWRGRMLVLTDAGTAAASESTAFMLRLAFGARIVGGRSAGMVEYGNVISYPLPGGTVACLASSHAAYPYPVEMVGLPVDVDLDPRTPVVRVAQGFDELWEAGRG